MADISKITLPDGVTYNIKASSMTTESVTSKFDINKTAGHWNVYSFTAHKCGNVVSLTLYIDGDGTNMSVGGTCFTGSLSKGYYPIAPIRAIFIPSNTAAFAFVNIEEDGSMIMKVQLGSINLSVTTISAVNFTYITDGTLHT